MQKNPTDEPVRGTGQSESMSEKRLDSWKEIAAYLNRDMTTVQRWEKREGMPVHRHLHDKRGSVYAVSSEIDAWRESRRLSLELEDEPQEATADAPTESDTRLPAVAPTKRRWIVPISGVAVLALVTFAYVITRIHSENTSPSKIKSLAVLPLQNLSGDPSQDYLAVGLTEELIGRLAQLHDLRVISRTSAMHFKDSQLSVPEIAKMLNVDAIVEGSVIRDGNRIRIHAQLIRAATDEHFWSETYDRELPDVLTLESEVAQSIAEKVEVTITGKERERLAAVPSVSPEVYESYLKGRFALDKSNSRAGVEDSIGYFDDAIKRDPTFAPAYLGLADAYTGLGSVFFGAPPEETRPKAISAARKALELDPDLAEAHVLLANVLQEQWHWAEAEAEYRRALELNPNDAHAHAGLALWLLCQGRTDEAVSWAQRGRELDPLAVSGGGVAWILFQSHRYDEALHELRSALAVHPDDLGVLTTLGFVLAANDHPKDAIPGLEKVVSVSHGAPAATGVLIRAYALAGRRADALRLLDEFEKTAAGRLCSGSRLCERLFGTRRQGAGICLDRASLQGTVKHSSVC